MTVNELLSRMSSRELSEWIAFSNIEPIGESRGDLRSGIISSTIVNMMKDAKSKPVKPSDFIPDFDKSQTTPETQTVEQQLTIAELLNAAYGGRDLRKKQ